MKKLVAVAAGLSIALAGGSSLAQSTMQDRRKEAEAFRDRIQAGTWEFMP
jgi:hypothetical protein